MSRWINDRYGGGASLPTAVGEIRVSWDDSPISREKRGNGSYYFIVFDRRSKNNFAEFVQAKKAALTTAKRLLVKALAELEEKP